jgi:phage-related protein
MAITVPIISEWNKTQLQKAQGDIETFSTKSKKAFNGLKSAGQKLALGLAGVSVAAIAVGKDLLDAGERASTSNARIDQITESMGLFGERTSDVTARLKELADETARKTGIDQNQIKQAQATLLTFKDLAWSANDVGGNFDRATQASIDLAAAGFGSVETNAVSLGKALNDPIAGLSALARSGVTFSEAEKEVIATLVESGNTYKAQQLILEAIEKQVGGTAEATANSSDQMKVAFSQLQEDIGLKLLPVFTELATFFVDTLIPALENAYNTVVPALKSAWDDLSAALGPIIEQIRDFLTPIIENIINFLKENTEVVKVFMAVLAGAAAVAMIVALVAAFTSLFNPVTLVIGAIAAAAAGVAYAWNNFETFRDIVTGVFEVIQTAVEIWWSVIEWVFENVLGGMDGLQKTAVILQTAFEVSFGAIKTVVMSIYDAIKSVIDIAKSAIDAVSNVIDKAKSIPGAGIVSGAIGAISNIIPFADGGIVTGPTLGLVGEAGPEAIIPLNQLSNMGGGMNITINMPAGSNGDDILLALEREQRRRGSLPIRTATGIKL